MSEFRVKIITPDKTVYEGSAKYLKARTVVGDVGIMSRHEPYVGVIKNGSVSVTEPDGNTVVLSCGNGFLSVRGDGVLITADSARS